MQNEAFLSRPAKQPGRIGRWWTDLRSDPKALAAVLAGAAGGVTYVVGNAAAQTFSCAVPATFVASSISMANLI